MIEIPYVNTYTKDVNSYYYGQVSAGEVVDSTGYQNITLWISDADGEEVAIESRDYENLIEEIAKKIILE